MPFLVHKSGAQWRMIYGYARVSTDGQSVTSQIAALNEAGCDSVFRETASGARSDRSQLKKLLAVVSEGDLLLVTRRDRLARSTRDLLNILAELGERRVGFRSLRDSWAD